jgi:uncharacterized phage protein gp47/JayE
MPAPYGVTPEGFSRPSIQEELAIIETAQRARISQTLDLSTESVLGQVNGILAERNGLLWEAAQAIHDGGDPDRAEDDAATSIAKITGTEREGASKSQLEGFSAVIVTLASGTTLQAGVHFAHVTGKPDVRFTPQEDFTAPLDGDYARDFESENTGPVQAPAGTLTVIATPVVGWSAVNNPQDATLGRDADDDADLYVRREQGLALSGSSGVDQIRADVLAVQDVTSCQVFENYTEVTNDQGLPPKSFQVVLWDDAGADDDAVAQAIWVSKPGGIEPIGTETGTATDKNGDPQVMRFSRASAVLMWLEFDLTPMAGYVGDAAFKLAIATALDTAKGTGSAVAKWDLQDAAHGKGAKLLNVRFGTAAAPTTDVEVPISQLEIARFDTSRIAINP